MSGIYNKYMRQPAYIFSNSYMHIHAYTCTCTCACVQRHIMQRILPYVFAACLFLLVSAFLQLTRLHQSTIYNLQSIAIEIYKYIIDGLSIIRRDVCLRIESYHTSNKSSHPTHIYAMSSKTFAANNNPDKAQGKHNLAYSLRSHFQRKQEVRTSQKINANRMRVCVCVASCCGVDIRQPQFYYHFKYVVIFIACNTLPCCVVGVCRCAARVQPFVVHAYYKCVDLYAR